MDTENIIKKPFVNYTLAEDRVESDVEVISLKVNKQERELIERLKRMTNYNQDAKVIKIGMAVLEKVILATFGADLFAKLTSIERRRPIFDDAKNKDIS